MAEHAVRRSSFECAALGLKWFSAGDADQIETKLAGVRYHARFRLRGRHRVGFDQVGLVPSAGKSIVHVPCTGKPFSVAGA